MNRKQAFGWTLVLALALLVALANVLPEQPVQAGPLAIPTPIAAPAGGGDWIMATYLNTNTVEAGVHSSGVHCAAYTAADVQHVLDITDNQTVTCKLQFSNDDSNWSDGLNVFATKSADENAMQQFQLFGRYSRITCTLGTANEFTVTVKAKLHN